MILLASIFFVLNESKESRLTAKQSKGVKHGFWMTNISLAIFLIALIVAGIGKGVFYSGEPYQVIMYNIRPFLMTFTIAGVTLMLGIWAILWLAYRSMGKQIQQLKIQSANEIIENSL